MKKPDFSDLSKMPTFTRRAFIGSLIASAVAAKVPAVSHLATEANTAMQLEPGEYMAMVADIEVSDNGVATVVWKTFGNHPLSNFISKMRIFDDEVRAGDIYLMQGMRKTKVTSPAEKAS